MQYTTTNNYSKMSRKLLAACCLLILFDYGISRPSSIVDNQSVIDQETNLFGSNLKKLDGLGVPADLFIPVNALQNNEQLNTVGGADRIINNDQSGMQK